MKLLTPSSYTTNLRVESVAEGLLLQVVYSFYQNFASECPTNFSLSHVIDKLKLVGHQTVVARNARAGVDWSANIAGYERNWGNDMSTEHIATYLNDHLAGSVMAVELMDRIEAAYAGMPVQTLIAELRIEIEADRKELMSIMKRLDISESTARKASAWIAEKFTEVKLRVDDPAAGVLRLFESLEVLSLGIEGKLSLWRALASAAEASPALRIADYDRLAGRAKDQRARVEAARLEAAKTALAPGK